MPLELSDVSGGCEEAALLGRGGACGAVSGCFARMGWAVEGPEGAEVRVVSWCGSLAVSRRTRERRQ